MDNIILDILEKTDKIYIFGAASRAKTIKGYMNMLFPGLEIMGYLVDDEEKNDARIAGAPVIHLDRVSKEEIENLWTKAPVVIATKGIFHQRIENLLSSLGFESIIPVSVDVDNCLRNAYVRKAFAKEGREFVKLESLAQKAEGGSTDACIYMAKSVYDKELETPYRIPRYEKPLQVGAALTDKRLGAGILTDDAGENISAKNRQYCETTGMYWVWKNSHAKVVGTCHYRRYLLNEQGKLFTEAQILSLLRQYDVITTKELQLNFSYYEGFASHHKILYLDETARVIQEIYPDYAADFQQLVQQKHTYFGNMLIAKKEVYDAYMEWLFSILFEMERRVKVEEEDSYHRRIFGFISEFLQYVWIRHNRLRVYACMVGMLGEKAEIAEVRCRLAEYFDRADVDGAKAYFLQAKKERPDLLMEASDITGELHLCMEVIAIAGLEQQAYGKNLLTRVRGFRNLMQYCNNLNRYVLQKKQEIPDAGLQEWEEENEVTPVARQVAEQVMHASEAEASVVHRLQNQLTK